MYRLGYAGDVASGHEPYRGMLVIPYITPTGVVDMKFRSLDGSQPKYQKVSGDAHLYNVMARHQESSVIAITEGELDAIVLDGLMAVPAIGIPGADHWKKHYTRFFQGYREIVVVAEGDEAGHKFGKKVRDELNGARVVYLPDGMDSTDVYLRSPEELRERLCL